METIKIIFYAVLIIIFFVLPIITLLIRLYQKPFKRYSRGVPEPLEKLRKKYNSDHDYLKEVGMVKDHKFRPRDNTNDKSPDMISGMILTSGMDFGTREVVTLLQEEDNNRIMDELGIDKGFDGGFGGGGFSGSGASASWSDDNSSSYSSSYDSSSSSSSDSSSSDSSSSGSDY